MSCLFWVILPNIVVLPSVEIVNSPQGSRWCEGRIVRMERWSDRLCTIKVAADIPRFEAGQFTRLALPVDGELIARPYSFVNSPDEYPHEFLFSIVPGGLLSGRLASRNVDEPILISPVAAGFFVLGEVPRSRALWMLATGTGIGPFLSMLHTDAPWQVYDRVVLVCAARTKCDQIYMDRLDALCVRWPGRLRVVSVLSRESQPDGLTGRIPELIEKGFLEYKAGERLDPAQAQVMICGNPAMIEDTLKVLATRGMRKHRRRAPGHITVENYW